MSADPGAGGPQVRGRAGGGGKYPVDAGGAMGVQVGEGNTQIIYSYDRVTWTDGVAPPPLADVSGVIDSPYRGLSPFEERDAAFFFGREAAATQVLGRMSRRLTGTGLLVVSGVSGAGKSSLLRAGVLPRLRGAGLASAPEAVSWPCLLFTPARAPLDELALRVASLARADAAAVRRGLDADPAGFALTARQAALAQAGAPAGNAEGASAPQPRRRLLLVVDQFEQLFTQCPDERQRQAFITALHAAATARHGPEQSPAALVVLGVRADFEAHCADHPQLVGAIQDRYLVTSMTERQLRMAIIEPAKKAGSSVDDDLTAVLLAEVRTRHQAASGAGILPLLSHALDQAWRSRTGEVLTLADYERTGGIEGAVADSAQRAYDALTPTQQAATRQVFTRLTATSSDGVDTADRAVRAELTEGKSPAEVRDVEAVLEVFAAERLLTLAAGTVEISHEVLLTAWPLLRDTWLAETHADRIVRTRLHNVATEWNRGSRDPSYLYSGSLLQAGAEAATRIGADPTRHPPLSQTERDFLHASKRAHRGTIRRRQAFTAFLMALVIGLASVAVLAFLARQDAVRQRDVAASEQLISQSEILGDADPAIAKLESIAAWRIHPSDETRYAMLAAAAHPGLAVLVGHGGPVYSLVFSPDGKTLVSGSADGRVRRWDVATRQQIGKPFPHSPSPAYPMLLSPDGKLLATDSADGTVQLWDVATRRQIGESLTGHTGPVFPAAFSRGGKVLATVSADRRVRLWDVATGHQIGRPIISHPDPAYPVVFSPDGKILAGANTDATGRVRLWDVATGRQIGKPLTGHTGPVDSLAFSPDGKTLATGGFDGRVRLWDAATHHQIGKPLTGHTGPVDSLAFSPDGKTLATGSFGGPVQLWDVATGRQIGQPLTGHTSAVASLVFSPDGKTLASGSDDGRVRLWEMTTRKIGPPLTGHSGTVTTVAFSPDGKTLATGSDDGSVRWWDVATGHQMRKLSTGRRGAVTRVAFSPDGKTLASNNNAGPVQLWDATTGQPIGHPFAAHTGRVYSLAFSPDGKTLASGSDDHKVRLWDVATGRQIGKPLTGHTGPVDSLAFSPNGKTLASGSEDNTVRLWDVTTNRQVGRPLTGHTGGIVSVAFSPDGKTLAGGSFDNTILLWHVATHRQIGGPLTGHTDIVTKVAFSPNSKTLASASDDGTVRLWDVATGRQIGEPLTDGQPGQPLLVTFSPDGKTLASGSADETVRLWDVAYLVDIVPQLCASTARSLTRAEWARYVPPGPAYQRVCP